MGAAKVGKTSIITQFLYNTFTTKYKRTIEEMHQGNFSIAGVSLTLDILDTAGSYEVSHLIRPLPPSSAERDDHKTCSSQASSLSESNCLGLGIGVDVEVGRVLLARLPRLGLALSYAATSWRGLCVRHCVWARVCCSAALLLCGCVWELLLVLIFKYLMACNTWRAATGI